MSGPARRPAMCATTASSGAPRFNPLDVGAISATGYHDSHGVEQFLVSIPSMTGPSRRRPLFLPHPQYHRILLFQSLDDGPTRRRVDAEEKEPRTIKKFQSPHDRGHVGDVPVQPAVQAGGHHVSIPSMSGPARRLQDLGVDALQIIRFQSPQCRAISAAPGFGHKENSKGLLFQSPRCRGHRGDAITTCRW